MPLLYTDPCFLEHDTGAHPESAKRLTAITERLAKSDVLTKFERGAIASAARTQLERVHSSQYIDHVKMFVEAGGDRIESDTAVSKKSYEVALKAAGTACDAVEQVVGGKHKTAMCLIRPPGHHALPTDAMGFCLFNNVAIAARYAQAKFGLERVLIVDWDVHHGNGTQDIFYEDGNVFFFSAHRFPFYPGSGEKSETGKGAGLGTKFNLPVSFGTARPEYHSAFESVLTKCADKCKPELVLISAGFDAHRKDPIGSLELETEDFETLTKLVLQVAQTHSKSRCVSLLEGGYNVQALAESVELHLKTLAAFDPKNAT